ncbi:sugar-phosphatase, partial [Tsukamurella sputi]
MSFKAIFLDLDGTSLNDNNALSPALQEILTILKSKGIQIIFS